MTEHIYPATEDCSFTIVAVPRQYICSFKCYEVTGYDENPQTGAYDIPQYHTVNYNGAGDWTNSIAEAQVYLSGDIKWDGCSNWTFDEQENVMLHFCGLADAQQIGKLFERLYEIAQQTIPKYEK